MKKAIFLFLLVTAVSACKQEIITQPGDHDLVFDDLAETWDEAIPLGNGMLGALVWEKDGRLRISLDRADLWDLRPMRNIDFSETTYDWVYRNWKNDTYENVQDRLDIPYNKRPAPTKIPAGAIEFNIDALGETEYVRLYVSNALCEVKWKEGTILKVFLDASNQTGWFSFENLPSGITPELLQPAYTEDIASGEKNISSEANLTALGYEKGTIIKEEDRINYKQEGWGGFKYTIDINWEKGNTDITGCWSISSEFPGWEKDKDASSLVDEAVSRGLIESYHIHNQWWDEYWNRSSIDVPDTLLEKQWYLEMYKFGSAARQNTPPIPLQGVWTADNGRLPPWKGDFHHDLNTQLSYWPAYSSNRLDIEEGFVDWLWKYKPAFEKYTSSYYKSGGLNVPGVTTLTGEPMGGWIQYSMGPTVSAWLGQHFYLHWRYSMDKDFLENRAYPWVKAVAKHFDDIAIEGENGLLKLPISSSPEIHNNSKEAWFGQTTNFDLALIRWTYIKAAEMAYVLGKKDEAEIFEQKLSQWPVFAVDDETGLMFAPGHPYRESHRHFSHLMAWHPLGLIDISNGKEDSLIIHNTLSNLVEKGSDYWVGYSFSWLGNLYARTFNGEKAAEALRIFASSFCLPNSFHANGDQSGKGYSKFTYRPFTLEGNFAFAAGVQEMLLQSHTGIIRVFPAVPEEWKDIAFNDFRTDGAFLISASMKGGKVDHIRIKSEAGGKCVLKNPFDENFTTEKEYIFLTDRNLLEFETKEGEVFEIKAGIE